MLDPTLRLEVEPGHTLLDALVEAQPGLVPPSSCGGLGVCGQCRVTAIPPTILGPVTPSESNWLTPAEVESGVRLACRVTAPGPVAVRPLWALPSAGPMGAVESLKARGLVTRLAPAAAVGPLGLAVDLGTSTIAAYLCDLRSKAILWAEAVSNPQQPFGADVISRIAAAAEGPERRPHLQGLAVRALDDLARRCLTGASVQRSPIQQVMVVGNTTMLHLLAGLDPAPLGQAPHQPSSRAEQRLSAQELGLAVCPDAAVTLFPVASGFVGGDAVAAALAEGLHLDPPTTLLVDIGTNGEVVLAHGGRLWATSCATGPALEGAGISCGMPAEVGAIHRVTVDPHSGAIDGSVLGWEHGARAVGLCGSGLMDLLAGLRRAGRLGRDGLLSARGGGLAPREVRLVTAAKSGTERPLTLTQQDICQLQLAKAALSAGVQLLLREAGVTRVERTVITGSFGVSLAPRSVEAVGLLPPEALEGELVLRDNLAGMGGLRALQHRRGLQEAIALSRRMQVLDLASHPQFADVYADATRFPALQQPSCPR